MPEDMERLTTFSAATVGVVMVLKSGPRTETTSPDLNELRPESVWSSSVSNRVVARTSTWIEVIPALVKNDGRLPSVNVWGLLLVSTAVTVPVRKEGSSCTWSTVTIRLGGVPVAAVG